MARKKKISLTLEDELNQIIADIEAAEENLKALKKSKKELEEKVKMDRLAALDDMIQKSGKSYDEVAELLNN